MFWIYPPFMFNSCSKSFLLQLSEVRKEVSLAIIKPDAVKAGLVEEIIAKVKKITILWLTNIVPSYLIKLVYNRDHS